MNMKMKKSSWRKCHKWLGIAFCFFMLMFGISGIVLNHRHWYGNVNVSRNCLPETFRFERWNNGLLRGTLAAGDSVLVYGAGGVFATDSTAKSFRDFSAGMPEGADARNVRAVVKTPSGMLFALSPFNVYRLGNGRWSEVSAPFSSGDRGTDMTVKGDTLVVLSRSKVYTAVPPYTHFEEHELKAPEGYDGKVSLFRTVLLLHSGELFGVPGKVVVDILGILMIFFCLSGMVIWLSGHGRMPAVFRVAYRCHELLGRKTIVVTLLLCLTGWALRPPLLIALVKCGVPAVPYSSLDSGNAWHDKLRMIRWDRAEGDWLVSTSEGFFSMEDLDDVPVREEKAPPVSVMGLNVLERESGEWLAGSFSGMYRWNRERGSSVDAVTGKPAEKTSGAPFGKLAVAGYSRDFACGGFFTTWYEGTEAIPQPSRFSGLPMSLWQLALEVHTGRIYTFLCGAEVLVYIFVAGLLSVIVLWSGWKIRRRTTGRKNGRR